MISLDTEESTETDLGHSVTILDSILSNCNDDRSDSEKSEETTNAANNEELIEELRRLKSENELLKNELKCVVALYEDDSITNSPLIQVTFKNEVLAQNYKEEVEMFLHNLLSKESEEKCLEKDDKTFQLQIYQNFCIDSVPDFNDDDAESWDIPLYNNAYNDILENQNGKIEKLAFVRCFNCLGNHFLDKCPESLDRQRIAYNRKFFFGIHQRNNLKGQQIKQFKPGVISKELRNALDLKENQLPPYIYKMRILDYPPGWLKEAEVCNTELAMYDCQGKVKLYEETTQNGTDSENHKVKYDIERIFQYPGFNMPVPDGFIDEYEEIGMPPLQPHHLIDFDAENHIAMPYIKRKFPKQSENNKRLKYDHVEEVDMDIENIDQGRIIYSDDEESHLFKFIPPLPRDTPVKIPTPPLPEEPPPIIQEAPEIEISTNFLSPTLAELEEEKQRLMNELEFELDNTKNNTSNGLENINNCDKREINEMSHIVLLGDYIFKNLCITTENKNWKIDIFTNDSWKLQTILEHLKSELLTLTGEEILFIHLGLNDFLSRGNNSLSEVCSSFKDSLYKIKTQVKVLILSAVLPFPHFDTIVNHKIQCLNMFNRELCKKENIGFINLRKAFMDNGVLNSDLFEDRHYYLNERGNEILLNVLLKNLEFAILKSKDVNFRPDMSCCQEVIEWFN